MNKFPLPPSNSRIGYQYFCDTNHFRQRDVSVWLPYFKTLGASWIVFNAPMNRAIPENFISSFISSGIEPIIHFSPEEEFQTLKESFQLILRIYAKWGIHYVSFFDRPNLKNFWGRSEWARNNIVDRFLDRYLPLANLAVSEGLYPVFPALQPGGDYWDLVFLRSSLRGMITRKNQDVASSLVISAIADTHGHPISWGMGGSSRWIRNRPYFTPPGSENHLGFHIFEWYSEIILDELGQPHPIILMDTGKPLAMNQKEDEKSHQDDSDCQILTIMKSLYAKDELGDLYIPPEVISGCFLIKLEPEGTDDLLVVNQSPEWKKQIQDWIESEKRKRIQQNQHKLAVKPLSNLIHPGSSEKSINHYLLIPMHPFGIADWDLDAVRPFILKNHPTVGFSLEEAMCASHVTVLETRPFNSDPWVAQLKSAGCLVDKIIMDGTNIAT